MLSALDAQGSQQTTAAPTSALLCQHAVTAQATPEPRYRRSGCLILIAQHHITVGVSESLTANDLAVGRTFGGVRRRCTHFFSRSARRRTRSSTMKMLSPTCRDEAHTCSQGLADTRSTLLIGAMLRPTTLQMLSSSMIGAKTLGIWHMNKYLITRNKRLYCKSLHRDWVQHPKHGSHHPLDERTKPSLTTSRRRGAHQAAQGDGVNGAVQLRQRVQDHRLQARDAVPRPRRHVLEHSSKRTAESDLTLVDLP